MKSESSDAPEMSLAALRQALSEKTISAEEATRAFLDRIAQQSELNAFITVTPEAALEAAARSDARRAQGTTLPLDGIPIAVKDNYCTQHIRTSAGSKMLANFVPEYESTVTQKLIDAGAIILGKTNMDEFAMGSSTETSHFGPTLNPRAVDLGLEPRVPGGSSGGSAAAVAARLCAAALGSDTGGSIRQPASFCGTVGFKPTYGVCSRYGIIAFASSLDQAGVFSKSAEDAALVMDVIAGEDRKDSTSYPKSSYAFEAAQNAELRRLKIGIPQEVIEAGNTEETQKVWDAAEKIAAQMNAELVRISIPTFAYALPTYYVIALCEASSNLARYDGVRYGYRASAPKDVNDMFERTRAEGFGDEVKRRVMLGSFALSAGHYDAYYLTALKVRRRLADDFASSFKDVDYLFMPTTPTAAFGLGDKSSDPVEMYLEDVFTVPVNLAGLPAMSVPVVKDQSGMPLSLQIVGPQFSDEELLRVGHEVERSAAALGMRD